MTAAKRVVYLPGAKPPSREARIKMWQVFDAARQIYEYGICDTPHAAIELAARNKPQLDRVMNVFKHAAREIYPTEGIAYKDELVAFYLNVFDKAMTDVAPWSWTPEDAR